MKFFDKIKEVKKRITEVEHNIYHGKEEFLEIYEKNIQLEKEIEERTKELNIANKRMLTLQNILDMMNSAKPLKNVLETVVNSIQGEFGYLHCAIKSQDEEGDFLQVVAEADDTTIQRANNILKTPIQARKLAYTKYSIFYNTIENRRIMQSADIKASIKAIMPGESDDLIEEIVNMKTVRSVIAIPLYVFNKSFGVFCVFSSRDELAKSETDFLAIYAQQIELAINFCLPC